MNKRKVYFRADASAYIGYGHFIRSLALADMLKDEFDCRFFTQSPSEYQKRECSKVCQLIELPSDDSKFQIFLDYLSGEEIVVLDNYFYTSDYQKQIKQKGCFLVHIDDIHDRYFYADIIINHGCSNYSLYDVEKHTRFCLGPSFALLRSPFLKSTNSIIRQKGKWVVCFGGSDPYNITSRAAKSLSARADVSDIVIIVGDLYKYKCELATIDKVSLYSSLSADEIYKQFITSEYVLCSASTVCYEALACGCNVIAGYYIDNQMDFYNGLCDMDLVTPIGNLLEYEFEKGLSVVENKNSKFNIQGAKYNLLAAFKSIDFRIVNYIDLTVEENQLVWQVRNLPEIRMCMRDTEPFSFNSHLEFVNTLKSNSSRLYYAIFLGAEFIGSYDFININEGDSAEHGLYINPKFHGKGYGALIENLMDNIIKEYRVKHILAEVLKSNTISYNYHIKVGYKVYSEDDKFYYLERYI